MTVIKKIGRIGQIISIVILVSLFALLLKYQNISDGAVIIGMGIFFVAMMGFVIFTMCVVLGSDTQKHIVSKRILQHFGAFDELSD